MSGLIQSLLCAACLGELWMVKVLHATHLPVSTACLCDKKLDAAVATWQLYEQPKVSAGISLSGWPKSCSRCCRCGKPDWQQLPGHSRGCLNACLLTAQPLHGMAPKELAILRSRIADLRWLQPQVINVPLLCCSHHSTAEVCADICTVGVSQMFLLSNWQRVWAKSVCCPFEQLLFIHGAPVTARQ